MIFTKFICTSVASHYELVKKAILAGKHVFCEKPLVFSIEKTQELFRLSHDKNVILYTDYIYTQSNSIKAIKKHWNELGDIKSVRMELTQYGKFYDDTDVVGAIGVHMLSVLAYLFDYSFEIANINKKEYEKDFDGHSLDTVLRFELNGVECLLIFSLLCPEKTRKITIVGTTGCAQFDMLAKQTVSVVKYEAEQCGMYELKRYNYEFDESNNLDYAIEDFINTVREKKEDNEKCCLAVEKLLSEMY